MNMLHLLRGLASLEAPEKILRVLDACLPIVLEGRRTAPAKSEAAAERAVANATLIVQDIRQNPAKWVHLSQTEPDRYGIVMIASVAELAARPEGMEIFGKTYSSPS